MTYKHCLLIQRRMLEEKQIAGQVMQDSEAPGGWSVSVSSNGQRSRLIDYVHATQYVDALPAPAPPSSSPSSSRARRKDTA